MDRTVAAAVVRMVLLATVIYIFSIVATRLIGQPHSGTALKWQVGWLELTATSARVWEAIPSLTSILVSWAGSRGHSMEKLDRLAKASANLVRSMLTLFQATTTEGWADIARQASIPSSCFQFCENLLRA